MRERLDCRPPLVPRRGGDQVLDEREGRATLTATLRYQSRAARDLVLGSPMEDRLAESSDKLAELLR